MKRDKFVLLLLVAIILIAIFISIKLVKNENSQKQNKLSQSLSTKDSIIAHNAIKDTISIPSSWKTYTNNKHFFTFQYPSTWSKFGEESNVVDRLGNDVAVEVNFIDSLSHSTLLVSYHLPPNGADLYLYAVSQYESSQGWYEKDGKLIEVDGKKAVRAFASMSISGRGTKLNPPLRLILVDFLDKQQTGAFQLQFKTPILNDKIEVAKFEGLLSTFKFTN